MQDEAEDRTAAVVALLDKLRARNPVSKCKACGEPGTWGEQGRCDPCYVAWRVEQESKLSKWEALRLAGVPELYRRSPSWLAEPWGCDPTYPKRRTAREWVMSDSWAMTLAGVTGSGKSMMAAELLLDAWRAGYRPALGGSDGQRPMPMWVNEADLMHERRSVGYGEPRWLEDAVVQSPVLVWEELGVSDSWRVTAELIERRYSRDRKTIFTTHRPISKAKAAAIGRPGMSIEEANAQTFSRLRDGDIGRLMMQSYRGTADALPA